MFPRSVLHELHKWRSSSSRKPLLIREARQVGKTTVVHEFARQHQQYIYLNLERKKDAAIFQNYTRFSTLIYCARGRLPIFMFQFSGLIY